MRFKIIIFFLFISSLSFAQKIQNRSTWILKGNFTSLIDVVTFPTVQLSFEKKLSRFISIGSEAGYQLYSFRHPDTTFLSPKGFKFNLEFRYYIPKFSKAIGINPTLEGIYLGLRPFYRQNQYTAYIPFQTKFDSININEDNFGVKNKTYGIFCMLGFQRSISDRLIFDFYSGLGIMKRKIENTDLQYNKDSGDHSRGTDLMQFVDKLNLNESSGIWGDITVGFRIGYKF
jgi:hypothetical protein